MDPRNIAGLKRKHAATEEPAKRAELAHKLRVMGHDPDEEKKDSEVPDERKTPERVTAEDTKPTAKAAKDEEADKPAGRRPGRPSKAEASSKDAKPETKAEDKPAAKAADKKPGDAK